MESLKWSEGKKVESSSDLKEWQSRHEEVEVRQKKKKSRLSRVKKFRQRGTFLVAPPNLYHRVLEEGQYRDEKMEVRRKKKRVDCCVKKFMKRGKFLDV